MQVPKVKICCISSIEEAMLASQLGAYALGLVGEMPSGPGVIANELICEIASAVSPDVSTFLLTSETDSDAIVKHHHRTNTNTIQLVDRVELYVYEYLRSQLPEVSIVQVIHVMNEKNIEEAIAVSTYVDALLLDSGNPNNQIKILGGTGKKHNWDISRIIRQSVDIPVFLAGGLNPHNVRKAIEKVEPFGVDLCTGVRTEGKLDKHKLHAFFSALYS